MIKHNYFKTNATFDQTTTGSNDISIIEDTGKLVTHNKEYQFVTDDFKKELDDNELVIASALNDLNLRLEEVETFNENLAQWVKSPTPPTPADIGAQKQVPHINVDISNCGDIYTTNTVIFVDSFDEITSTSNRLYILNDDWENALSILDQDNVCHITTSQGIGWMTNARIVFFDEFNSRIYQINVGREMAFINGNMVQEGWNGTCDVTDITTTTNKLKTVNYSQYSSQGEITIYPGTYYVIDGTITNAFEFKLASGKAPNEVLTHEFEFITSTSNITLPSTVKWQTTPNIQANKRYYVKIRNNIGTIIETDI